MENANTPAEVELDLKDMFIYCFLHWRSALLLCLIFGLLLGAFKGYRSYASTVAANNAAQKVEETLADTSFSPSESLQNAIGREERIARLKNNIVSIWDDIQAQESSINESTIMKLDPDNISKTISAVMISAASSDEKFDPGILISEYKNELFYGGAASQIALDEDLGLKESDVLQLIDFLTQNEYLVQDNIVYSENNVIHSEININYSEKTGADSALFYISAKGSDAASEKMMSTLLMTIPSVQQRISASTGIAHSVSVLSTYTVTVSDDNIRKYQETQNKNLETLYANFDKAQDTLTKALSSKEDTSLEKVLSQTTKGESTVVIASPLKAMAKEAVKWSCLGAAIAFLIYGLLLCILYALGRPKTLSSLSGRFPLRLLGGFRDAEKNLYKGKTRFDRWLRKAAGINPEREDEKVYDMVASNLSVFCGEEKSFIIAGSDTKEHRETLCRELSRRLPEKAFTAPSDILRDPESRNLLGGCDAVIFSEIYGKSSNRDLQDEIALISGTGIKVAGMITQ